MPVTSAWVDGVPLDIIPGDISHFDETVEKHIAAGGGWLYYPQPYVSYRLHITSATSVIIRYAK